MNSSLNNKLGTSKISDKSNKSRLSSATKKSNILSKSKNDSQNLNFQSQQLSAKSINQNFNKSVNPKEEKLRESIKSMFSENAFSNRSKKQNKTTSFMSDQELKIKFMENNKKVLPYEEQIKFYLKKNFENKYLCPLCLGLFNEPITCYKCNSIFCKDCLKDQLDKKGKCNICFNIIFLDQAKFFENDEHELLYEKTLLNCIYYPVCKKTCNLYEITDHINDCVFKDLKINYDNICALKTGNINNLGKYNNIFENEVLEYNDQFIFHKLSFPDRSKDPFLKLHLFDYLQKINKTKICESFEVISKSVGKFDLSSSKSESSIIGDKYNMEYMKNFKSRLVSFNSSMNNLNTKIGDCILDLANITKISNDKMKNMINN